MDTSSRRLAISLAVIVAVLLGVGYYGVLIDSQSRERSRVDPERVTVDERLNRLETAMKGTVLLDAGSLEDVVKAVKAVRSAHDQWRATQTKVTATAKRADKRALEAARKNVDSSHDTLEKSLDHLLEKSHRVDKSPAVSPRK